MAISRSFGGYPCRDTPTFDCVVLFSAASGQWANGIVVSLSSLLDI
jgi:hypothetical protein